jgi:hypothetical protein
MLSVFMLKVGMLSVIILSTAMLSVTLLNAIVMSDCGYMLTPCSNKRSSLLFPGAKQPKSFVTLAVEVTS